jgi:hypothetical protein
MRREQQTTCEALLRHLVQAGVKAALDSGAQTPGGQRLVIGAHAFPLQVKAVPVLAERIVESAALHLLRARRAPAGQLLVLRVERLPGGQRRWIDELTVIQRSLRSTAGWAVVSDRGGALLQLPGAGLEMALHPDPQSAEGHAGLAANGHPTDLHASDVAMAALKISLLRAAAAGWIDWTVIGPGGGGAAQAVAADLRRIDSVSALAAHLRVSNSAIYTVYSALSERGWIVSRRGRLAEIGDLTAVVAWWIDQRKHRRVRTVPVAPLYQAPAPSQRAALAWLRTVDQSGAINWAVTGWAACQLHRRSVLNHTALKPVVVTVRGPVGALRQAWSLHEVPPERALFQLQSSPASVTAFAMATRKRGLPTVDLWEAALEVASDPQRGIEQTRAIAEALFGGER